MRTLAIIAEHLCSSQVRLIGLVGAWPDVRRVGDQTIAQVSLGIRPKTGNTNEISWVVCDFWNHEVHTSTSLASFLFVPLIIHCGIH